MAAKFTIFLALCAIAAARADSDIQTQVFQWANEERYWLEADGTDFTAWVAEEIANANLSDLIKVLLNNFITWGTPVMTELRELFTALAEFPANPSSEELQQLRKDISTILDKVADAVENISERCDDTYTDITLELYNADTDAKKNALNACAGYLQNKAVVDEAWGAKVKTRGNNILSQIPAEE